MDSVTITQLEYIIAVDTYKGFGEAAKKCFVTQPTLSMQIKKLEDELGILIFDRSKKPVLTTDIGKKIISQAKIGLDELSRIHEIIENEKEELSGTLRLGIIPTISPYLVPRFASQFVQQYPKVRLKIEESLSQEIIKKLQTDQLDVGIMVAKEQVSSLSKMPIFYEKFLLYFSDKHPLLHKNKVLLSDLNMSEIWLLKEGHCFRDQIERFCGENFAKTNSNQLHFESGSLETLRKIVDQQTGFTLLPELAVRDLDEAKIANIRNFAETTPIREVSLVTHRSFLKERLINALKEELLHSLPPELLNVHRGSIITWD